MSILGVALVGAFVIKRLQKPAENARYTIGILQTASHPALDAAREGFMQELQSTLGNEVAFVIQNAQGSVSQAHSIAQQFHANKKMNGFFAIATPAAQAMSAVEKERPIIISAVTDPLALGIIHPTTNVCGTKDMIDVKAEIDMLLHLVPHAHHVGLVYTSGEVNSRALSKLMRKELEARGIVVSDFAFGSEADVHAMVELACRKADVILAPTDNTVASTIAVIAATALKHKKPLFVSDNMLVKSGALAARGVDYKTGGKRAAQIAHEVIVEGKKPFEVPVEQPKCEQIFINQTTLEALGLTIPTELHNQVVLEERR